MSVTGNQRPVHVICRSEYRGLYKYKEFWTTSDDVEKATIRDLINACDYHEYGMYVPGMVVLLNGKLVSKHCFDMPMASLDVSVGEHCTIVMREPYITERIRGVLRSILLRISRICINLYGYLGTGRKIDIDVQEC